MVDNTLRAVPIAKIQVSTPYFRAEVEALCPADTIYGLIIGNVPGVWAPHNPDQAWVEDSVVTKRAKVRRRYSNLLSEY